MYSRYKKMVIDHPALTLLLGGLITLLFLWRIPDLEFSSSSEAFFIKDDPDKLYYHKAKTLFGSDQVVIVALVTAAEGDSVYTPERLARLGRLTTQIAEVEGVLSTVSLINVPTIRAPRDPATGRFAKALEVKTIIPRDPKAPGGFPQLTREQCREIKAEVDRNPLYHQNLVSKDGRAAAVVVFIQDFEKESKRYGKVMAEIKKAIALVPGPEAVCVAGVPETRVEMVKRMIADIKRLLPLTFLVILGTLVVNFWQTGTGGPCSPRGRLARLLAGFQWRPTVITLIGLTLTTIWALGFMSMIRVPINMVTLVLPPLLLAMGSSYSIYITSGYLGENQPGLGRREVMENTLDKQMMPIVVCAVTNMFGFGSLMQNRIPAIRELGLSSTMGILFAMLIALFVLPAVLMLFRQPEPLAALEGAPNFIDRVIALIPALIIRRRPWVYAGALIIAAVCVIFITRIKIDTDFLHYFAADDPVIIDVELQTRHLAGAAPFNIVLEANREDAFKHPAMLKRMEELQRWAEQNVPGIDTSLSMADYIKLLNQAVHENDPAFYVIPDTPAGVSQLLFLYAVAGKPTDFAPYMTSDYSAANILIRSRLVGSTETNRAIRAIEDKARELFKPPEYHPPAQPAVTTQAPAPPAPDAGGGEDEVQWSDTPAPAAVPEEDAVEWSDTPAPDPGDPPAPSPEPGPVPEEDYQDFPWPKVDVHMTGTIYLMNKSADAVSSGQISGFTFALSLIFLTMALLFLSFKIGLLAILPNLFPIFMLFGIMGISDITLNFSTSLIASIALGMGVEDTIHYIHHNNREIQRTHDQVEAMVHTIREMGKPMASTSIALFLGFAVLAASNFVPIRQFGLLTGGTLLIAIVSNLIILPSLMVTVRIVTLWDLLDLAIGDSPAHYIKIFHGLSNHQARVAVLMGFLKEYKDGDWIFREDEMGSEMFVVIRGQVNIVKGGGKHEIILATTSPGDAFGEMALLRHTTRTASARAAGPVKLFVIDEHTFFRLQKRYPKISSNILYQIGQSLSDRLQAANLRVYECSVDLQSLDEQHPEP